MRQVSSRTLGSLLAGGTPIGRATADAACAEVVAAARAASVATARRDEVAGVGTAETNRRADSGAELAAQSVKLLGGELRGQSLRGELGLPEDLVGEKVSDPGNGALVEQTGLERGASRPDQAPEVIAVDVRRVGSDVAEVRLQEEHMGRTGNMSKVVVLLQDARAHAAELAGAGAEAQAVARARAVPVLRRVQRVLELTSQALAEDAIDETTLSSASGPQRKTP